MAGRVLGAELDGEAHVRGDRWLISKLGVQSARLFPFYHNISVPFVRGFEIHYLVFMNAITA